MLLPLVWLALASSLTSSTGLCSSSHSAQQAQVCNNFNSSQKDLNIDNADIYCASRSLYGLAKDGQAPAIFAKARKNGNPIYAVGAAAIFILLAYMNAVKSSSTVFGYLVSLVTVFAVLNWVALLVSHICFRNALKAQNISLNDLPYVGKFQPWGSYYALFMSVLVIIFNGIYLVPLQVPK